MEPTIQRWSAKRKVELLLALITSPAAPIPERPSCCHTLPSHKSDKTSPRLPYPNRCWSLPHHSNLFHTVPISMRTNFITQRKKAKVGNRSSKILYVW